LLGRDHYYQNGFAWNLSLAVGVGAPLAYFQMVVVRRTKIYVRVKKQVFRRSRNFLILLEYLYLLFVGKLFEFLSLWHTPDPKASYLSSFPFEVI
jgi:hypothetical protein